MCESQKNKLRAYGPGEGGGIEGFFFFTLLYVILWGNYHVPLLLRRSRDVKYLPVYI